jgi:hypothetical protein
VDEAAVSHNLVRRVKSMRCEVRVRMVCAPRFNYARSSHRIERCSEKEVIFTSEGEDGCALRLRSSVPLNVQPGPVDTDMNPAEGEFAEMLKKLMALPRYAHVDEIAAMIAYLAGPEAGFVTGASLMIDGGFAA